MNKYVTADRDEQSEINLTPMLDVVFILLIFFVVTASFVRDFGISISSPIRLDDEASDIETIVVEVGEGGSYAVNGRALSPGGLAPYIMNLHAANPAANFLLHVRDRALVENTVFAADAGRAAGFDVIPIKALDR